MTKKRAILTIFFSIIFLLIAQPSFARNLTIVFTGDTRGEIENCHCPKEDYGGLPRRAKYIDEVREGAEDLLLLDIGDILPLYASDLEKRDTLHKAFISFKAMDMMGYSVMNVGESDLVLGEDFLSEKESTVSFPFISANIVDKHTGELFFKPYLIKEMKNGLKVGVIGLVNERYIVNSDELSIVPHKEAIDRFLPELKANSDIVIALAHLGLPYSIELANYTEDIDVILSGHWDATSQEPMKVNSTLVMPTTYHSRKVGRLDLEVGRRGVYSYRWESTPLNEDYNGNAAFEELIATMPDLEGIEEESSLGEDKIFNGTPLRVFVFYSPGCRACIEIEKDFLPGIEEKYGSRIALEQYDVSVLKNYEQMMRLEELYGAEDGGYVPEVIVSGYVLMGKEDIIANLDQKIQKALTEASEVKKNNEDSTLEAVEYQLPTGSLILSRFQSFSVFAVMTAGLLDGVNPCAFTTIVFFISFLSLVGYKRREMFAAGSSFTVAVFIAYLLIGLGIFRFLRSLQGFGHVIYIINIFIGGLAFILGILSLVDYFKFKKTKDAKSIILKLPQSIKNKIHSVIGADFRPGQKTGKRTVLGIMWIAFTAGFMVSILESFCTGQVYLPTIAFVLKMPEKKTPAFVYLVLYNLAFIMPLIAVFLLGFFGATSKAFSKFIERRLGAVKLCTALLFFLLATALILFR
ncbi:MAG: hypothetical protein H8D54_02530 [Candidatus Omnitrophica bacterium]|nr:hypothetical protein [Candidatus Omnitrophota bacterium]